MLPLISIIVPVYNVEDYIRRCFASVTAQNYENLECIIVDDCGEDKSMTIVEEIIAAYQGHIEFKILRHQKNRGLSAARNTGTAEARGDYVYYLDSDDMLMPDSISLLAAPLREQETDFVIGNYSIPNGIDRSYPKLTLPDQTITDQETIQYNYLRTWYMMAWNKLVRKAFLIENDLSFAEGIIHEDDIWSFQLATLAKSMTVVNLNTYFYNIRESSITTENPDSKHHLRYLPVMDKFLEFASSRDTQGTEFTMRVFIGYENYIFSEIRKTASISDQYAFYRKTIRKNGFNKQWYAHMQTGQKLRYIHHLLPPLPGYLYLAAIDILFPHAKAVKNLFCKPS